MEPSREATRSHLVRVSNDPGLVGNHSFLSVPGICTPLNLPPNGAPLPTQAGVVPFGSNGGPCLA